MYSKSITNGSKNHKVLNCLSWQAGWWEIFTFTWAQKHPVIFVSSTQTIDLHKEESSVCLSLNVRDLGRKRNEKSLWEHHASARRWDGQNLTFPSTPTPQSASWIMLTSFPPSPKRKQKPWRCQDSHRWFHPCKLLVRLCVCVCASVLYEILP